MLTLRQRRKTRIAARRVYLQCGDDFESCEVEFKRQPELVGIDPTTILIMLKIAWELWKWWQSRKAPPPEFYQPDEPGFKFD